MAIADVDLVEHALAGLDGAQLGTDALLLAPEHRGVDGVGVVRLHELVALGLGMLAAVGQQLALGGRVLVVGGHLGGDRFSKALGPVVRHFDAAVEVIDFGFELVGGDVALLAASTVAAVPLAKTVEVRVRAGPSEAAGLRSSEYE